MLKICKILEFDISEIMECVEVSEFIKNRNIKKIYM
ncbi:hypothetical protein [Anaerococcus vaginalis]